MHFLHAVLYLATAAYGAAVPIENAPQLLEREPVNEAAAIDKMDLIRRQSGFSCLANFPLFNINRANRQNIQSTITWAGDRTYDLGGGLSVEIVATNVAADRHVGIIIQNTGLLSGSIVLSNYQDTRDTTNARETIQVDYDGLTTRTCIRIPRRDGTWYVQRSR